MKKVCQEPEQNAPAFFSCAVLQRVGGRVPVLRICGRRVGFRRRPPVVVGGVVEPGFRHRVQADGCRRLGENVAGMGCGDGKKVVWGVSYSPRVS